MEWRAELSSGGFAVAVSPGGYIGEVRIARIAEDVLCPCFRGGRDEVLGNVGDGLMAVALLATRS